MPDELFNRVGVITCIMVFEAHSPHTPEYKTFFGYFKDDGFIKSKHLGRIDKGAWEKIKSRWIGAYINHERNPGISVLQTVAPKDEWCAEAYMETNYSNITRIDFERVVKNYAIFKFLNYGQKND